jgi:hypothetical protein
MVNKRGDLLTPAQLIIIVLSIIGLVIGLAALYMLDLRGEADDKACRLSVLSRAGVSSVLPSATQGFVPLKCTTDKICITTDKNIPCSQFAGEKDAIPVVIPRNNAAEAAKIIEKTNVESMYDCWNLMGQGKLDIFPGTEDTLFATLTADGLWSVKQPTCFICSRIALSSSFNDSSEYYLEVQDKVDIASFMEKNRPEGSQNTYLELFTSDAVKSYYGNYVKQKDIIPSQSAIVFAQIVTKGSSLQTGVKTFLGTGASLSIGAGWVGLGKFVFSKAGAGVIAIVSTVSGTIAGLSLAESQSYSVGLCGDLSSNKESARQGCSVLGRYDYNDISKINSACSYIEGNP